MQVIYNKEKNSWDVSDVTPEDREALFATALNLMIEEFGQAIAETIVHAAESTFKARQAEVPVKDILVASREAGQA